MLVTLDDDGMGTFIIYAALPTRTTVAVLPASSSALRRTAGNHCHTVTFGAATPGEGGMVELMMPTGVTPRTFPGSGSINVSWTAGQGC